MQNSHKNGNTLHIKSYQIDQKVTIKATECDQRDPE